jgi:hypothetical protein
MSEYFTNMKRVVVFLYIRLIPHPTPPVSRSKLHTLLLSLSLSVFISPPSPTHPRAANSFHSEILMTSFLLHSLKQSVAPCSFIFVQPFCISTVVCAESDKVNQCQYCVYCTYWRDVSGTGTWPYTDRDGCNWRIATWQRNKYKGFSKFLTSE